MTVLPNPPVFAGTPMAQITPFTYREGATLMYIIERLKRWSVELGPAVELSINNAITHLEDHVDAAKLSWQELFDRFMANVVAELEALNDQAMANLIRDQNSLVFSALKEVFSPFIVATNYAKGDGVTDDTNGLQMALDLAEGKTLIIPVGDYKITKTLRVRKNTVIYAYGATIRLWTTNTAGVLIMTNGNTGDMFTEHNGNGNITIHGGTWDAQAHLNAANSSNGFAFAHAYNLTFRDMTIKNLSQGHGLELNSSKKIRVENCSFLGWGSTSVTSEAIQIDAANSGAFPAFGEYDGTPCVDVVISGNSFGPSNECGMWGIAVGSHSGTAEKPYRDIRILNNYMEVQKWAVAGYHWTNTLIDGNQSLGGGFRVMAPLAPLSNVQIKNNTTRNTTDIAVGLQGNTANGYRIYDSQVTGNSVDTGKEGVSTVYISYANNALVSNNHVVRSGYQGIRVSNSLESEVVGNTIKDCANVAIAVTDNSDYAHVANNLIVSSGRSGIEVDTARSSSVMANKIHGFSVGLDHASAGIRIFNGQFISVMGNQVRKGSSVNLGTYGLVVQSTANATSVMGNDFRASGDNGTFLDEGTSTVISGNAS